MKRFLLALLPAVAAYAVILFSTDKGMNDSLTLIWIAVGLLFIGGVISGVFVAQAVRRKKPELHVALSVLLILGVAVVYFVTLFFAGCLSAAALA